MKGIIKPYMVRPIIQKTLTRILLVIVLCMLWDRFLNKEQLFNVLELPLFICSVILLAAAWFNYLKLDGMRFHYLNEEKSINRKKKRHSERSVVDFVDEKVVAFEELEPSEQTLCTFISNLLPGLVFLFISVIAGIILR